MSLSWSEVSESFTATICAMCGRSLLVVQTEGGYALGGTARDVLAYTTKLAPIDSLWSIRVRAVLGVEP